MKNWLRRFFTIQVEYTDAGQQQLARRLLLFNMAWITICFLATPLMVLWMIGAPTFELGTAFVFVTLIVSLINHGLIVRGSLLWARRLFVLNMLATTLFSLFPDYRLDSPFIIVLTVPVTAAGMLLRRSGLLGIVLFLVGMTTIGGMLQIVTDMEATPIGQTAAENIRTTIILIVCILFLNTVMLWTFGSSIEKTMGEQKRLVHLISAGAQLSQTLTALPDSAEALNQQVEDLREVFGLYHVQIYLVDPANDLPTLRASTGLIGRRLLEEDSLLTPDQESPINEGVRQAEPILILETSPEVRRKGFLPATRSELLLPLRVGSLRPIGVLDLHSTAADAFSSELLNTLVTMSDHLAVAIYAAQQANAVQSGYRERDQLIEQLSMAQREVAHANRQLTGATWGTYLDERPETVPGFQWHAGVVTPLDRQPAGLQEAGQPRLEPRGDTQVLVVPIQLRGQVLGTVEFSRPATNGWSSYAVELVEAVAERLALSLENARLFEQAQTTAQREQLVSQVTTRLQASNDLQTLLTLAAVEFQDALGAIHTQVRLGIPSGVGDEQP